MEQKKQKRRKKKISKKTVITLVIVLILAAVAGVFGVKYLQRRVSDQYGTKNDDEVLNAEVTKGSIKTTVSGSGSLEDEEYEQVEIPAALAWKEAVVEVGDTVKEGDLLASIDAATVMEAMADLQDQLADIDDQLADASGSSSTRTITAPVAGRVKVIYAAAKDDVATVMADNGALLLMSLDGYMAVDIETKELTAGDSTKVVADGTTYTGTVDKVAGGTATVLIADTTVAPDVEATVKTSDGKTELGTGKLYIHQSLAITDYTGTVYSMSATVNKKVSKGATLMKLTDASGSAGYTSLLADRKELEEDMQELVGIYKTGALYAPCGGTIKTVTEAATDETTNTSTNALIEICPDKEMFVSVAVDETNILQIKKGQEASVTVESVSEDEMTGEVTEVESVGTSSSGVTTYTVKIKVDKVENMLSGMTASVRIIIEGVEDALIIPEDAVHKTRSSAYVYTSYNEETGEYGGMTEVTVGMSNGSMCEITEGLKEGDVVYYTEEEDTTSFNPFGGNGGMPSFGGSGSGSGMPSGMPSGGPSGFSGGPSGSGSGKSSRSGASGAPTGFSGGMPRS